MAKKKVRFRGVKHAPKRLESDLLQKSQDLLDDPGLLRPKCAGTCRKCHFDKPFDRISKLEGIKNDPDALIKASKRGPCDITKAYAATASLGAAGEITYLATAKIGGEDFSFAKRGSVGNDKLIGCQYYNDPRARLLLYNDMARKKKLHIYSFDDIVCSNAPNMPEDYLYDAFWDTPYEFPDDELSCGHEGQGTLVIEVKSLGKEISICRNCAKDISTLQSLISRISARDPLDDFDVSVRHKFHSAGGEGRETIPPEKVREYAMGKITDSALISSVLKDMAGTLKKGDVATFVSGSTNHGSDLDGFLESLRGSDVEKEALKAYLSGKTESVIIRSDRASEALNALWPEHWKEIISSYTTQDIADTMDDQSKNNPAQALTGAWRIMVSKDIIGGLPDFGKRIGPMTKLADAYARAAKVGGAEMLLEETEKNVPRDNKSKAMARAFDMSLGAGERWKMSGDDLEFSNFLIPFIKDLLEADGEAYRDKMNTLLTATGSGEKV
ncbi:MAG: hypothetical protein GX137_04490 [Thermoplasmatales archaeon]|jgi:hypothetical protein|nr:hypothetical protein [Thermoplasmatales archaeon]